jgi:hypothetical protein
MNRARWWMAAVAVSLAAACVAVADDDLLDDDPTKELDGELEALFGDRQPADFAGLRESHLSNVSGWRLVKPLRPTKEQAADTKWRWRATADGAVPLGAEAISTRIAVPVAGDYRLCLRQAVLANKRRPVTMTITRVGGADAANGPVQHVFGDFTLKSSVPGGKEEVRLPVRFETEAARETFPGPRTVLWEHWDVTLAAGEHEITLAAPGRDAEVSAVFLSRSRSFRPSLASHAADATLGRVFVRYKILDQSPSGKPTDIGASLTYHWARKDKDGNDIWGWDGGGAKGVAAGEWSPFIDVAEAVLPGPGPWSTWRVRAPGAKRGRLVAQFAWTPQEAATMFELETALGADGALFRYPNQRSTVDPAGEQPAWGVWNQAHFATAMTQEAVIDRYYAWADEAAKRLGLPADHPKTRHIRLKTGCNVLEAHRERAADMLARVGANWIDGAPPAIVTRHGLHEGETLYNFGFADPKSRAAGMTPEERSAVKIVKIGDEISTAAGVAAINTNPAALRSFRDYLRERMEAEGSNPEKFLGVADLGELCCVGELPDGAGRFERRLFYHSARFRHLWTARAYRAQTERITEVFPNALVYNNYTPHPLFLTGSDMNEIDWFVLCRNRAQSLGGGEDWAYEGGWSLGTAYQIVSFYAAFVECAIRRYGQPGLFYAGVNCGGGAQKIFSCVGRGLNTLELYSWGPIDGLAEGSNAWSESRHAYFDVMQAAHALGPADAILEKGRPEPRRAALLYNRSHEICQRGGGRLNQDWMWTYLGLMASHVPVDLIIEEDLDAEHLAGYDVLLLGGYNLESRHVAAIHDWVERGGLLVGSGGAARLDVAGDPSPATERLFAARQRPLSPRAAAAMKTARFQAPGIWPEPVEVKPKGILHRLEPLDSGKPVASYDDGSVAAVEHAIGKGRTILLGFHPGFTLRDSGGTRSPARAWLAAPVIARLGRPRADVDDPSVESAVFEHDSGIAVLLSSFGPIAEGNRVVSVATDRTIREVTSSLRGPLQWERKGERIEVQTPPINRVDVVILR